MLDQIGGGVEHGVMLNAGSDQMALALGRLQQGDPAQRQVVRLGPAAGEDDLGRLAVEDTGDPVARVFERRGCARPGPCRLDGLPHISVK